MDYFLGIEDIFRGACLFKILNEGFLQLSCAWVKDPERGINLSKGGNISVIRPQLILLVQNEVYHCVDVRLHPCSVPR